jgi:putative ABC transport system permease protein
MESDSSKCIGNMSERSNPPKWINTLLTRVCKPDLLEEIEGDLFEYYQLWVEKYGAKKANRLYVLHAIKFLRPFAIKNAKSSQSNTTAMFRHNFLITFRNFKRYKSSFFINLIGLSTGLVCVLLIYLWVSDELSIDKFHTNDQRLYQMLENVDQGTGMITRRTTAGPTAKALAEEMPEVEYAVSTTWVSDYTLSFNNKDVTGKGIYASKDYFELFSYKLIQGESNQVLADKKSIVLSKDLAVSLFGTTENVVGKILEWQHEEKYQVSGIFEKTPNNSSVQFDFLLTFEGFLDNNEWATNWFNTAPSTFLLMKEGVDIRDFNSKVADLVLTKTEGKASHRTPFITRYSDVYLYSKYENGVQSGGRITYVKLFSIIALFVLVIACINFMNLSTARASRRIKEVGIKKALGAYRGTLIGQYLGESILLSFLSLVISMMIVLLPQFSDITGKQLQIELNLSLLTWLSAVVLVTGLLAGSYPALYLSKFNPISIFKNNLSGGVGEAWVRKGLVIFQFTISIVLIISVLVVYKQIEFTQNKSLGYKKDNILIVDRNGQLGNDRKLKTFITEIQKLPGIEIAASSGHDMTGHNGGTYGVSWPEKDPEDRTEFERMAITHGMMDVLGIEMKEGRAFSEEFPSDSSKIIFNEAGIDFMGLTDPVGKVVELWGEERQIIGVVKNFHFESFHENVKPLFFWLSPGRTEYIMARIEKGKEQEAIQNLEKFHANFNPGFPINYRFLDSDYQELYESEERVSVLSSYFAGIAILISCLGLFGLVVFTAERRMKEIGIRKILGSSSFGIIGILSFDLTKMVVLAILIGLPVSYFIADEWLDGFAFRIALEWWFFVGAGFIALLIAWLTVSFQILKTANVNPIECWRNE